MAESEVPLDLQRQIEDCDREDTGGYGQLGKFVDTLPDDRPEECPGCGAGFTATAVFANAADEAVAVRLVCTGTHDEGRVAQYIYEVATGETYLEREEQPKRLGVDPDEER